jgi:hypothetical protein
VEPRSSVPVSIAIKLQVASSTTEVTVEAQGGDLVENNPTLHTGVDKNLFDKRPLESQSSSVSSLVNVTCRLRESRGIPMDCSTDWETTRRILFRSMASRSRIC